MRLIVVGVVFLASAALVLAQHGPTYGSLGGFGNVLYPGTGHAPNSAVNTYSGQVYTTGGGVYTTAGRPYGYPVNPPRYGHPGNHGRGVIVPYPVFIGGGYYGGYAPDAYAVPPSAPAPQDDQMYYPNQAPSVVINQTFVPDRGNPVVREYPGDTGAQESSGLRTYQSPQTNPYADMGQAPRSASEPQATIYLLAFKDHNIIPALGYWMEGNTLHYVSVEHSMNQVSIDLIDRDLSQRLNDERGVEFKLPKQ